MAWSSPLCLCRDTLLRRWPWQFPDGLASRAGIDSLDQYGTDKLAMRRGSFGMGIRVHCHFQPRERPRYVIVGGRMPRNHTAHCSAPARRSGNEFVGRRSWEIAGDLKIDTRRGIAGRRMNPIFHKFFLFFALDTPPHGGIAALKLLSCNLFRHSPSGHWCLRKFQPTHLTLLREGRKRACEFLGRGPLVLWADDRRQCSPPPKPRSSALTLPREGEERRVDTNARRQSDSCSQTTCKTET